MFLGTTLRATATAAAVVVGALLVVGCSQSPSMTTPTSASGVPTASAGRIATAASAGAITSVVTIPVSFTIQPSGQAAIQACVGEPVTFVGEARFVAHQTRLGDGSILLDQLHLNPQGAVAVGGSTGTQYRLVGGDSNQIVFSPGGTLTATFTANLRIIGPGSAKSFLAHILQHIALTPDGQITALVDVLSIDCR